MNYQQVCDGDAMLANSTDDELFPDNYTSEFTQYLNNSYDEYYSSYPGGYLSMTTDMKWLPHTLFTMVFVLGIPANALVIFVLLRNGALRITTNMYLFNLAVTDFLFLVLQVPAKIGVYMITPGDMSWKLGLGMCKFSIYVVYVNMAVSIITLTALAVNRYCAVMHPISSRTQR
ncbi:kappa-type opioid receptor-like [Amphiura filiformis]|uniref:kappa-type opioid receptor-like n=1 Tax=Amphiura filiformis TaxID=82378 RepID=UPI003B223E1C